MRPYGQVNNCYYLYITNCEADLLGKVQNYISCLLCKVISKITDK